MRIIALIDDAAVIERILKHLKVWDPGPAPIRPAGRDPPWPKGETLAITYHPGPVALEARAPVTMLRRE